MPEQHAEAVAQILAELLDRGAGTDVADALLQLLDALHLEKRRAPRRVVAEPLGALLVGNHVDIGAHLVVEILLDATAPQGVAQQAGQAGKDRHRAAPLRRGLDRRSDRRGDALPAGGFRVQVLPAGLREAVVLRLAPILGLTPFRGQPSLFLEAMQGRKERPRFHFEHAAGDLGDAPRDAEAVVRAEGEGAQDQQVKSALQQAGA